MNVEQFTFEASFGTEKQLLSSSFPEIVFAGRSNVGKSSLLNCLLRRNNIARVSSTPGKTITINFFRGKNMYFVDLPGYGYAKRSKNELQRFAALMNGYFSGERNIALVCLLLDLRHEPSKDDCLMLDFLQETSLPFAIILTKQDKLKPLQREKKIQNMKNFLKATNVLQVIPFSSETRSGREALLTLIETVSQTQSL